MNFAKLLATSLVALSISAASALATDVCSDGGDHAAKLQVAGNLIVTTLVDPMETSQKYIEEIGLSHGTLPNGDLTCDGVQALIDKMNND